MYTKKYNKKTEINKNKQLLPIQNIPICLSKYVQLQSKPTQLSNKLNGIHC